MAHLPICLAALTAALWGCSDSMLPQNGGAGAELPSALGVEVVGSGYSSPIFLTAPAGDARLFVVEQPGRVRIIEGGEQLVAPFLDISDRVLSGGERGLFSIAFHPDYASNGFVYASYTDVNGDTRIDRFSVSGDPSVADPGSAKLIFSLGQPFANHNGGLIAFGPDGMLYIGLGDGGSAGDPLGNGQNRGTLLGALLRIDVDGGDPYAMPPDNPFGDELWAYGLRNPWRFAFDRVEGTLYIADVGQNLWEEINVAAADDGGLNYGWSVMEGAHCFQSPGCDMGGLVLPVVEYGHSDGCSVTGGYVYRGGAIPGLRGHYLYSDYCSGFLRSFRFAGGAVSAEREWDVGDVGMVLSFGEDASGELYVLSANGNVYRIVEAGE